MLSIKNIVVTYGMFRAVDDVSIEVGEGQIVGIVGANGAGKSTMINAVSGMTKPTSGTLRFEDIDLTKMSAHAIVRAGVVQVPEGRRLFPEMTVYENLLVGSSAQEGEGRTRARTSTRCSPCSHASRSARARWLARFPAASSR